MEQKKSLTLNGMTGSNLLFILTGATMVGVSIYLTSHFYETLYPTSLGSQSTLCNLSNFFNCDGATYSNAAHIAGVPTSYFGIVIGIMFLFGSLMPSESQEKTLSAVSKYNFIGCLALFVYSLISIGSLCPFCTFYYFLSGVSAFLLWKYGINSWVPEIKNTIGWAILVIIGASGFFVFTQDKEKLKSDVNAGIVKQYEALATIGDPDQESPYKIHSATPKFADAPIRISVFSDFECPFCKKVAEQLPEMARRYPKQINIQYFFFPLDAKCNSNIKSRFHENACDAAMLAACDANKFLEVHDEIFVNQERIKAGALKEIAEKHGLNECFNDDVKNKVISLINGATKFNLKSTPTIILNGKKIEGTIPNGQFFAIFETILSAKQPAP